MNIIRSTLAALAAAVFFSGSVFAETVIPKGVGCDTDSGECFIILDKPFVSKVCGGTNNQLRLDANKLGSKNQYSAALAAYMAGKKLEVGSTLCLSGQPSPSYLYVTD